MNLLSFLLYYLIMVPLSWMPFFILHGIADVFSLFVNYVLGYRKKVVYENLRRSFPEKNEEEIKKIANKFYRFVGDLMLEGFKAFTLRKRTIEKRLKLNNPEILDPYYNEGKSVIIAIGHYNSWEMFLAGIDMFMKHKAVVIYQPLSNTFFDKKLRDSRSDHGTELLSAKNVKLHFQTKHAEPCATIFAIDQSPAGSNKCYWMEFLHQETGVLYGTEKFAKDFDQPVFFARINKERRGYYSLDLTLITDRPKETAYGEITEKVTHTLEKDIIDKPEFWLWSHRRWKHKRPVESSSRR